MKNQSIRKTILALALIASMLLSCFPALADTTATVRVASAPVYTTPNASTAKLMGTLKIGTKVIVRAVSGGVAKITVSGKTGYMNVAMLDYDGSSDDTTGDTSSTSTTVSTTAKKATVTADRLTVYKSASTSSGVLGTIRKGLTVSVVTVNGSWAAINVAGKMGYCSAAGLSISDSTDNTGGNGSSGGSDNDSTGGNGSSGQTGGTPKAGDKATAVKALKFYKSASTSSASYGTFSAGATMEVRAVKGQWAKVVYKGKSGFVLLSGLQVSGSTGDGGNGSSGGNSGGGSTTGYTHKAIVATSIYQKPSTSSKVLKQITAGQPVTVKGESGGWLKLSVNGVTCYALEECFIEISSQTSAMVIASSITVYASPSLSAPAIGTVAEGASLDLYASSNGWAKVLFNGHKGYVLTSRLVMGTPSYTTLKIGNSGTAVRTLQDRLEKLGYFDGVPGGNYGSITASAVKRFQNQMGLNVTGTANNATQAALFSDKAPYSGILTASLSNGAKGELVTRLQTRLLYKSYYTGNVSGSYDAATTTAVKAFQKKANLPVTGSADSGTLKALFAPGAPTGSATGGSSSVSLDPPDLNSGNEDIETVIRWAIAQIGKPYVYGTAGPDTFDCSGLTYYCFKKVGITLPRSAYDVGYSNSLGERISYEELRRGDVVCFNTISDSDLSDHVGIYLGNGLFIHSPHTGSTVLIASMTSGYYLRNFSWARRPIK